VVDATLGAGVCEQLAAFRGGFCEVFPLQALALFCEDELELLLCGAGEAWSVAGLADAIKFDHGYNQQVGPGAARRGVCGRVDQGLWGGVRVRGLLGRCG
jgi:E3 ubiquitin-protein ligase TRIP12